MKIIDESTPNNAPKPSMFLHGLTGHGKSTWSQTGGRPLVILTEPKAQSVLRRINPQAVGLVPESLDDLDHLMVFLGQPDKLAAKGIDRIVLDSFTELTQALPRWLKEKVNGPVGTLVKLELSEFGSLRDYALAVVKAIQLTGYPSVIIGRSISKRVGLADSIRPDGAGKSVDELPGKLLPTAEARYDVELGYVIDTTPADHSQRCGLPWVPAVYSGPCLGYLQIIEAGPQADAPAAPEPPKPAAKPAPEPSKPKAEPPKPTGPSPEQAFDQALIAYADALHKAGWPPAERKAMCDEFRKHGPSALAQLQQACSGVTPWQAPVSQDPAWVALMVRLAEQTQGRPADERQKQVAAWEADYREKPEATKERLEDYVAACDRLKAMGNAPDPELDPEGYRKAFSDVCATLEAEKRQRQNTQNREQTPAAQFANAVAAGPGTATAEDIQELLDLCRDHKVNTDAMWKYALAKGGARADAGGAKNWFSLQAEFLSRVVPLLKDNSKRAGVISWLHNKYQDIPF